MKRLILFLCALASAVGMAAQAAPRAAAESSRVTQEELARRTQEMLDAVAGGDRRPWEKYLAEDCLYFDEKGNNMDKAALLKGLGPLPKGYSGSIRVVRVQSRMVGTTAILSYDMDEKETIYGQELSARYHATHTWMYRKGRWQIVASQVLRYYEDPAVGKEDPAKFGEYAGSYELAPGVEMGVTVEEGQLYAQRHGRAKAQLLPEAAGIFFRKGVEGRVLFRRGPDGAVEALIDRRNNEDVVWKKAR